MPEGCRRSCRAAATVASFVLGAAALIACEAPAVVAEPSGDLWIMSENWDLEFPASATLEEYYSSKHGPHGERDAVYVLSLDAPRRTDHWDPAEYTSTVSDFAPNIVQEIVDEADARFTDVELQDLHCRSLETPGPSAREGNDHLVTCVEPADGRYVIFERIF